MASLRSLVVAIGADTKDIDTALARIGTDAKKTAATVSTIGGQPLGQAAQKSFDELINKQRLTAEGALKMAAGLERIGGASSLTVSQLGQMNKALQEGVSAFAALGQKAPAELQRVADSVKDLASATKVGADASGGLGLSWIGQIASGVLLRDIIRDVVGAVKSMAAALPEIAIRGSAISDVEENFKRLTTQAGLLGNALLGALNTGTHNTVDNFTLMKLVNQDLAAGLVLTDKQFSTLSQGAFALAQATGTDVATGLETMNDALLTGRTRALALLTGKIDLTKAEETYAKSLGSSVDHLTADGKLEAARVAILNAVGDATTRLGVQTDGLDEKIAQSQVSWANLTNELEKTVATSPVIIAGFDGIKQALFDTFGGNQQAVIAGLASAVDDAAIAVVRFGKVGIEAGGVLVKEFYAIQKVMGDVAQVVDGVRLAFLLTQQAAAVGILPGTADLAKWKQLDDAIGKLEVTMKQRGDALKSDEQAQASVDAVTAKYSATLDGVVAAMTAAKLQASAFVGPLQEAATAQTALGVGAGRTTGMLQASKEELAKQKAALEQFAKSLADATSFMQPFAVVLNTIDGSVVEGAKDLLIHGAKLEDVARIYGLTAGQIASVNDELKLEQLIVTATGQSYAQLTQHLDDLEKKRRAANNTGFTNNLKVETTALQSALDQQDFLYLTSYGKQVVLIQREANERRRSLDSTAANYNEALAAIQTDTEQHMNAAARAWAKSIQSMDDVVPTLTQSMKVVLGGIPNLLVQAFTGGGGLLGAVKSLGVQLGEVLVKNLQATVKQNVADKGIGLNANTVRAASGIGAASGVGALAGGASTGQAIGAVGGAALGVAAGALASGATLGATVALGAATFGVGIAAVGAYIAIRKLLNDPEKKINPLRQGFIDSAGGLAALNEQAHKAGATLDQLLDAKNPQQYQAAIESLSAAFQFQDQAMQTLDDTVKKYGFTIAELGPAFQRQELDKKAAELFQDFKVLTSAGIDVDTVISRMGDSINAFINDAILTGTEVPDAMRPMLQRMVEMGKLTDSSGNAFGSLEETGISFTETMSQGFTRVVDEVKKLTDAISRGLGLAIANVPDPEVTGHVRWSVDPVPGFDGQNQDNFAATGGLVTANGIQHFAGGGRVLRFQPRGTDTVPAMLTPGEVVLTRNQQRSVSAAIGAGPGASDALQKEVAALRRDLMSDRADMPYRLARAVRNEVQKARRA